MSYPKTLRGVRRRGWVPVRYQPVESRSKGANQYGGWRYGWIEEERGDRMKLRFPAPWSGKGKPPAERAVWVRGDDRRRVVRLDDIIRWDQREVA